MYSVFIKLIIIFFIFRRHLHGKTVENRAANNPAYADTTDNNIAIVSPTIRTKDSDGGPADEVAGINSVSQFDSQYNVIESVIDEEYNKITFKGNRVPFDENYGHVNQDCCTEGNEYNHIGMMHGETLNGYSSFDKQCLPIIKSDNALSDDHLLTYSGNQMENVDKKVTKPSVLNSHKQPRPSVDRMPDGKDNKYIDEETLADAEDKIAGEHSYFVLESEKANDKVIVESGLDRYHQYFVLEPNTEIHTGAREVYMKEDDDDSSQHNYCDLQLSTDNGGVCDSDKAEHKYSALENNINLAETSSGGNDEDKDSAHHQYFVLKPIASDTHKAH